MEALGEIEYLSSLFEKTKFSNVDCGAYNGQYWDTAIFHQLEEDGFVLEFPSDKITTLFNYARLLEQQRNSERASILYRLILFKVIDLAPSF